MKPVLPEPFFVGNLWVYCIRKDMFRHRRVKGGVKKSNVLCAWDGTLSCLDDLKCAKVVEGRKSGEFSYVRGRVGRDDYRTRVGATVYDSVTNMSYVGGIHGFDEFVES
jgi:hypothetical protein